MLVDVSGNWGGGDPALGGELLIHLDKAQEKNDRGRERDPLSTQADSLVLL